MGEEASGLLSQRRRRWGRRGEEEGETKQKGTEARRHYIST